MEGVLRAGTWCRRAHGERLPLGTGAPFGAGARALPRLTAVATLDALAQLHPGTRAEVAEVEVRTLGAGRIAVVAVCARADRGDEVLVGSAAVRSAGESDAVARAVLDALNRRLAG